jgi:hypothetical protein
VIQPPKNQAEWLLYLADLAEKHPLEMITPEGTFLQLSFVEFLRSAGSTGTPSLDLQADLITMLPRFCMALLQAEHGGDACKSCGARLAGMIFNEIVQHQRELAARQNTGGVH